ncbi:MAG: PCRF domain-containing protein, partial [Mariprofundaceae bacterium]|nr:PCRF domain-containing protein [Mariprofundaceae bacterium]
MNTRLDEILRKKEDLAVMMADPETTSNPKKYTQISKEYAAIEPVADEAEKFLSMQQQVTDNQDIMAEQGCDPELKEMAQLEILELKQELEASKQRLDTLLIPKDPNDDRNVILEIRAGTGGDEAALFAADLFRMYSRYAERKGFKVSMMTSSAIGIGGYKEIVAQVTGTDVFSLFKFESGAHRVQRVPETESSGRVHTSACTVAILPEAEEVEITICTEDLRIDVYRASGAGGQHVNKTESAVRLTHAPSGLV